MNETIMQQSSKFTAMTAAFLFALGNVVAEDAAVRVAAAQPTVFAVGQAKRTPTTEADVIVTVVPIDVGTIKKTKHGKEKSPERVAEETRLRKLAVVKIPLQECTLQTALSIICDTAKMNYIAPDAAEFSEKITLRISSTPFSIIETLGDTYGFESEFVNGVWRFYKVNVFELVTRSYQIKHNDLQRVKLTTQSINSTLNRGSGSMFAGGNSNGGSGGVSSSGHNNSSGASNIEIEDKQLVEDLKRIIGMETTGLASVFQIAGTAGKFSIIEPPGFSAIKKGQKVAGEITYIRDTQTLIVSTTRQIHGYVEQYIAAIDQPIKHIQFGIYIVETSEDGGQDFGINWSGVSGRATVTLGNISTNVLTKQVGGIPHLGGTPWPNAVLSISDLSLIMNMIRRDTNSVVTQNPVIVARNNERTKIAANLSTPIQSANSNYMTGAGSSDQQTIEYLDTGTVIEVIPQVAEPDPRVGNGKNEICRLTVILTIRDIVGQKMIGDKEYPIIASRDYAYSVEVPDGYTLAIGGLKGSSAKEIDEKIPFLGDIPGIGRLFKSTGSTLTRTNMLAFVTPHIIQPDDYERGGVERLRTKGETVNAARISQGNSGFLAFDKKREEHLVVGSHSIREVLEEEKKEKEKHRPERVGAEIEVQPAPLDI